MNWIPMKMKFPGKCIECGEAVNVGESGLWMKGTGVKHERCGAAAESGDVRAGGGQGGELRCLVCGKPAGCPACEFSDTCDTAAVSQLCMCRGCMDDKDTYALYRAAASRKFPGLEPEEAEQAPGGQWGGGGEAASGGGKEGGGEAAGAASPIKDKDAGGPRRMAQGQLVEVDIAGSSNGGGGQGGGGASGRKRRGSASGQQRL